MTAPTVRGIIDAYLPYAERKLSRRAYGDVASILRDFAEEFAAAVVAELKGIEVLGWINNHVDWRSSWTLKRVLTTLQACLNWSARMGLIERNPIKGINHEGGERGRPMEDHHFRALLRHSDALFRRFLLFLYHSGCRPGEAALLEWADIDWERGLALLMCHKTARKTRKPRVIYLTPVALRLLLWMFRHDGHTRQRVFVNRRGNPWNRSNLALRMTRTRRRAGVPGEVKMYGLRHRFASNAILSGIDLSMVAELMGHRCLSTTLHYVHLSQRPQELRNAAAKASAWQK